MSMAKWLASVGATVFSLFSVGAHAQFDEQLVKRAQAEGEIVWYTADTPVAAEGLAAEFKKRFGVTINVSRKLTQTIVQQFKTESSRGSSPADVITLLGMGAIPDLAPLLARYVPKGAAQLPPQYRVQDLGFAYSLSPMGLVYNTRMVSEDDVKLLRSYDGWLNPRFAGKIAMAGPFGGTTGSNMQMIQEKKGIDFIKALVETQKAVILQNVGQVGDTVIAGERAIGLNVTPSLVSRAADGAPIRFISPDEWALVVATVAAINAKAPHPNAARLFLEWVMTPETQKLHDNLAYWVPTLPGVKPDYPKAEWLTLPKNPIVPEDEVALARRFPADMERWRAMFRW